MNKMNKIDEIKEYLGRNFLDNGNAHDYNHMIRVYRTAMTISEKEGGDKEIIGIASLLHDVADHKFLEDGETEEEKLQMVLDELKISDREVEKVKEIILNLSFKGGTNKYQYNHIEGKIVRDADRLDSIGAIGIARTFAYGGSKGRVMYDPNEKPMEYTDFEQYKKRDGTTINHFYEKLLKIKDTFATETALKIAGERHRFMEEFLEQFYKEWNGRG